MLAGISLSFACVVAFPTGPSAIGIDVYVVAGVWVALRAMSLAGIPSRWAYATQDVDAIGHSFHVIRVDAKPVSAEVVDL